MCVLEWRGGVMVCGVSSLSSPLSCLSVVLLFPPPRLSAVELRCVFTMCWCVVLA